MIKNIAVLVFITFLFSSFVIAQKNVQIIGSVGFTNHFQEAPTMTTVGHSMYDSLISQSSKIGYSLVLETSYHLTERHALTIGMRTLIHRYEEITALGVYTDINFEPKISNRILYF